MNMPPWINMKRLALLMVLVSGSVTHVVAAGDPTARPATPATTQAATGAHEAEAAAVGLPVRERLQRAIDVSRTLAAKGQRIDDNALRSIAPEPSESIDRSKPLLFPRMEDVEAYMRDRPWASIYAPNPVFLRPMRLKAGDLERWPTATDAPELRKLLEDKDPAMRCVAAEALATLYQPEDVERIGRLLKDDADGVPALGWNSQLTARKIGEAEIVADGWERMRSWHNRTVAATARLAVKRMTGEDLTAKSFDAWWQRNSGGRNCVWYWQQRLTRELAAVEALTVAAWQEEDVKHLDYQTKRSRILAQQQERFDAVRQAVAKDLSELPAEIEAKVRLCAINRYSTSLGVSLDEPLMGFFTCPRIGPDRLLELLDRKNLWEDVDWKNNCYYNNLVVQVVGRAELFFTREHVERLRAIVASERGAVWWSGQAAFVVGISHLLPPAKAGDLDNADTRDGLLRRAALREGDTFVRGACARELVRIGLPANREFLTKLAFGPARDGGGIPTLAQSMLQALGDQPLSKDKRGLLIDLVLDKQFEPSWTRPNARMGDDMDRLYATRSINAHAGRELIPDQLKYALVDPKRSAEALATVRQLVGELRNQPATEPATQAATTQAAAVPVIARYAGRIETLALDNASKQEVVLDAPVIVRNARDYDAFVARIPAREISKTNPSPPSADPLLKKPEFDFQKQMLIAVICAQSMYLPPEIASVRAAGDALEVTVVERERGGWTSLNEARGIGTYSAVVVAKCAGAVKFVTQPARRPD